MMRIGVLLASCVLISAGTSAAGDGPETIAIENDVLRLEIQTAPGPCVSQLVHKTSGQALVRGAVQCSLFSLDLVNAEGAVETIDSARAGTSTASVDRTGQGCIVTITCTDFPGADLSAVVTVVSDTQDPLMRWSLRVDSDPQRRVQAVRFPQLRGVPAIDAGEDDCLVLPALPGTLIQNPAAVWSEGQSVVLRYPGDLSAQFLAWQDRTAGIYLAAMDSAGHPMSLGVQKEAEGMRLWHAYVPVPAAGGTAAANAAQQPRWESPYPVAVGVTQGTWHTSADQYKQWAVQQPWCARQVSEREDIPQWWKEGPAVHVLEVRTYDDARACSGSYYPQLLQHLRTFRDRIDAPVVPMLAGWENHRRWTAGDYFPVFDAEQAQPVLKQLRDEGFRPFVFLSGLFFTFHNVGRDGGDIPAAAQYLPAYVVDAASGQARAYELNESSSAGQWERQSYQFCVAQPPTAEFFGTVIDRLHALGIDVLQMDQTTSGAGDACAAATHDHPPGVGLYQSHAFWQLLHTLRQRGKRHSADFVLFHEEPHEQLIPYVDGFHVREYYEKRWYRAYPGAVGIPLFAYLYHEYALGYGGDSASLSPQDNRWLVRCHAMNLVTGRTPGASVWSATANMFDAHRDQMAMIRQHCQLLKTRARDFLLLGRMLHPLEIAAPELAVYVPVQRAGRWEQEAVPTPAILTSSWQAPDGRVGHLFVNISSTNQPLRATLDTRTERDGQGYDAEIYRSAQEASFQPLWQHKQLPAEWAADLAPLEVVFVELSRGPGR